MEIRLLASTVGTQNSEKLKRVCTTDAPSRIVHDSCSTRSRLFSELVQYIKVDRYVREPERPRFYLSARSEI